MDAAQWLAAVFTPALGRDSLAYSADADLIRGQLAALHACDVLDDAAHADALARLAAAVQAAERRAGFDVQPPRTPRLVPPPAAGLPRVFAVAEPLATADGMPLVLTSVELWPTRIDLFIAGIPTAEAEQHRREQDAKLQEWAAARATGHSGEGVLSPPMPRGHRLFDVDIRVRDDVGTTYRTTGGSSGGSGTDWRVHRHYEPSVPPAATQLAIEAADRHGHVVGSLEVLL
ncbi:hypothetical protein [Dactylosporangium sp. NPDC000521]|uniref:hypothetical protein n=1 Tax=Dactylosporangium sp. NPDC000521 TaxID=3363975 RepID=UPI0036838F24